MDCKIVTESAASVLIKAPIPGSRIIWESRTPFIRASVNISSKKSDTAHKISVGFLLFSWSACPLLFLQYIRTILLSGRDAIRGNNAVSFLPPETSFIIFTPWSRAIRATSDFFVSSENSICH